MVRSFVLVVALGVIACKSPPAAEPAEPELDPAAATAVVQLDEYRSRACACTDVQCTLALAGERASWLASQHGLYAFTPEQRRAADTANRAYDACNAKREADDDPIRVLEELTVRMCACKDKACAESVIEHMMKLGEEHRDTVATAQQMKQAAAITERLTTCMSKAMGMTP